MRSLFRQLFWFAYRFLPGFRSLALRECRISKWKEPGLVGKFFRRGFFDAVYPRLPVAQREEAQQILMGNEEAVYWAQHHQSLADVPTPGGATVETFPPRAGESRIGDLDFLEAFPLFNYLDDFLRGRTGIHVIQIGTSSGKEIAWLSGRHPGLRFSGTDRFDSVVDSARRFHRAENLMFLQASAENVHLIAESVAEPEVVIFTSGAALYIFPEVLPLVVARLAQTAKKIHLMICEPNSRGIATRAAGARRSAPSSNMGYNHDYRGYAEAAGFTIVTAREIEPYADSRFPEYLRQCVVTFAHFLFSPTPPTNRPA